MPHNPTMKYWLLKSEPTTFSISDLVARPSQTSCWDGVRNYQARNMLRDDFAIGDRALFYHSSCKEPAVVGTAFVVREGYPDHHAFDPKHHYFDPKSLAESPTWYMVDVQLESVFPNPVTLACLRTEAAKPKSVLTDMMLLRKGSRLSVQPVTMQQFNYVCNLGLAKLP